MSFQLILGRGGAAAQGIGFKPYSRRATHNGLITYSGDAHIITIAPTGAGKTSGPVITNSLKHEGQLIAIDPKGEIYRATAKARRAMGQKVHVIDLRDDMRTDSLNPLKLAMYCGSDLGAVARSFATGLIDRPTIESDPFWDNHAQTLLAGITAWLLAYKEEKDCRLSGIFDLLTNEDTSYELARILDDENITHKSVTSAFRSFLNLPEEKTRPCVLGTAVAHIRLFDSDLIRTLTDTTTINIDHLINGKPMSLYFIVPPHRLQTYRPLLRLWLSGLLLAMTQRKKVPESRTLFLCDEVGNLGRIDALLTAVTLMRSWGVTLWTFWQNAAQLSIYGEQANTFVDNAGIVQAFGVRNQRMATELSALIGGIGPDEIMKLAPDEQLLLIEGKLTRCKQVRYYNDKEFMGPVK